MARGKVSACAPTAQLCRLHDRTHKSGKLPFSHDLPVMISVVDSEEKLTPAIKEIEAMMQDGIMVLSDVDVIRLVHSRPAEESSHANS